MKEVFISELCSDKNGIQFFFCNCLLICDLFVFQKQIEWKRVLDNSKWKSYVMYSCLFCMLNSNFIMDWFPRYFCHFLFIRYLFWSKSLNWHWLGVSANHFWWFCCFHVRSRLNFSLLNRFTCLTDVCFKSFKLFRRMEDLI